MKGIAISKEPSSGIEPETLTLVRSCSIHVSYEGNFSILVVMEFDNLQYDFNPNNVKGKSKNKKNNLITCYM